MAAVTGRIIPQLDACAVAFGGLLYPMRLAPIGHGDPHVLEEFGLVGKRHQGFAWVRASPVSPAHIAAALLNAHRGPLCDAPLVVALGLFSQYLRREGMVAGKGFSEFAWDVFTQHCAAFQSSSSRAQRRTDLACTAIQIFARCWVTVWIGGIIPLRRQLHLSRDAISTDEVGPRNRVWYTRWKRNLATKLPTTSRIVAPDPSPSSSTPRATILIATMENYGDPNFAHIDTLTKLLRAAKYNAASALDQLRNVNAKKVTFYRAIADKALSTRVPPAAKPKTSLRP
ncbi:hypothetical protein PSPO01_14636 [Paraphaeosphaeria sporulosa]